MTSVSCYRGVMFIKNVQGFSLVGVIIVAGLMSGLALVLAELRKQQLTLQKKSISSIEVEALAQRITRILYNAEACLNTIGKTTDLSSTSPISLDSIKNQSGEDVIKSVTLDPNAIYGNGLLKIDSIDLRNINIDGNRAELVLSVTMKKTSRAITGYKTTVRDISLEGGTCFQPTHSL